jgi:hypothetical protein
VTTGLLPVLDASGEPYGVVFSRFLTASILDVLIRQGWSCLLLNPGELYSPIGRTEVLDYSRKAGVDQVVALTLKPARRKQPAGGTAEIQVEGEIVAVPSGGRTATFVVTHDVKRVHLDGGFDLGPYPRIPRGAAARDVSWSYWAHVQTSRRLSKQPLGKAALRTATTVGTTLAQAFAQLGRPRPTATASLGACDVEFRVQDAERKWSSKSYMVVVNGRDESTSVRGGVLNLTTSAGPVVFEVAVKDAPFGTPIQAVYLANAFLDCASDCLVLSLDIGKFGEALLVRH